VVDVVNEPVQRAHTLAQPLFERGPFVRRKNAGDDVERNRPFRADAGGILRAVNGERDADTAEVEIRFRALVAHLLLALRAHPGEERMVVRASFTASVKVECGHAGNGGPIALEHLAEEGLLHGRFSRSL
jgi:hypothetical protein